MLNENVIDKIGERIIIEEQKITVVIKLCSKCMYRYGRKIGPKPRMRRGAKDPRPTQYFCNKLTRDFVKKDEQYEIPIWCPLKEY